MLTHKPHDLISNIYAANAGLLHIYLWRGILLIEFHFDETSVTEYERHSFDMIHSVKRQLLIKWYWYR